MFTNSFCSMFNNFDNVKVLKNVRSHYSHVSVMTAKELCLHFNHRKSHCIVFGPRYQCKATPLYLYDKPLQWVCLVKYLGVTLMSSKKISFDLNQVSTFIGCVNLMSNHSAGMSDMVNLHLAESYCYPLLSYAPECFNFTSSHMQQLSACWNSVYRKIFHYKPSTSVRKLIYCLGRTNFEYLFYKKKLCFVHSLRGCKSDVVLSVMEVFVRSEEDRKVYDFANVKPCDNKATIRPYTAWE